MISYVIPTRDRPAELTRTLDAISRLGDHAAVGGAEVVIADNASSPAVRVAPMLASGVAVRVLRRERNEGAAARNACALQADPRSTWLVMLDDDSHPLDCGLFEALSGAPSDVAALQAEITLPDGTHEAGGLPEVFVGCGVAIRRDMFVALGGYDASFDYYAEEYDLAARIIAMGARVGFDRRFRVEHRKVSAGRNFGRILRRLVRNNAWVARRYAPEEQLAREMGETLLRYARIAWRERVPAAYALALVDLARTLGSQRRTPLPSCGFDRLTGLAHARAALAAARCAGPLGRCALVHAGKNAWAVRRACEEMGLTIDGTGRATRSSATSDAHRADTLIIATLSPGPMLDAYARLAPLVAPGGELEGKRIVLPWADVLDAGAAWASPTHPPASRNPAGTPTSDLAPALIAA